LAIYEEIDSLIIQRLSNLKVDNFKQNIDEAVQNNQKPKGKSIPAYGFLKSQEKNRELGCSIFAYIFFFASKRNEANRDLFRMRFAFSLRSFRFLFFAIFAYFRMKSFFVFALFRFISSMLSQDVNYSALLVKAKK
jgi:hypothetical protein